MGQPAGQTVLDKDTGHFRSPGHISAELAAKIDHALRQYRCAESNAPGKEERQQHHLKRLPALGTAPKAEQWHIFGYSKG